MGVMGVMGVGSGCGVKALYTYTRHNLLIKGIIKMLMDPSQDSAFLALNSQAASRSRLASPLSRRRSSSQAHVQAQAQAIGVASRCSSLKCSSSCSSSCSTRRIVTKLKCEESDAEIELVYSFIAPENFLPYVPLTFPFVPQLSDLEV